ncbi:acidic leucine-rich nuclear phosphoprotein 32 family member B [Gambusia affinis]|uniref:acidic leucine-rich nuclear phosphoprotein 32 family member B n=1 Tax=Gambusia affinis TaxID=33528 RepID=UPI001CDBE1FF|nr:acidic leucine-rich nuclear phosphoprotein 32 family member B [Gambusia affinis]XP_043953025.1 acidic leucine-rich nuclear phosphoprotein 32 family member B [Gambusia affinis]XP_043953026.1 acidic leucine-rich nuclear phosphoprotein 32 family member B [Gambusia affinis]
MSGTVVALSLVLLVLVVLLVFFYKKLNKEANNQYTVQNIIYKEGGVRDQMRATALAVETRLGVQVWPRGRNEEDEMVEIEDEEGAVESGDNQSDGSSTDGEDEQEEDSVDHSGATKENEEDNSDAESSEAGEEDGLIDNKPEENEEVRDNSEEKQEKEVKEQGKAEASGGTGLLIDLKQFSGSAIWSEQKGDESQGGDVTAL